MRNIVLSKTDAHYGRQCRELKLNVNVTFEFGSALSAYIYDGSRREQNTGAQFTSAVTN